MALVAAAAILAGRAQPAPGDELARPAVRQVGEVQFEQSAPAVEEPAPAVEADPLPPGAATPQAESLEDTAVPSMPPVVDAKEAWSFEDVGGLSPPEAYLDGRYCDDLPPIYSTGTWYWRGNWFTQQDFLVWTRDDPRRIGVATDFTTQLDRTLNALTTASASPRGEGGARLTIGRLLGRDAGNRDHLMDFTFFGLLGWNVRAQFVGAVDTTGSSNTVDTLLGNPGDVIAAPFFNTHIQTWSYDSDLNNFELNYRLRTRPGRDALALQPDGTWTRTATGSQIRSVLGGLRVISINELFEYDSVTADETQTGRYNVFTNNDLIGPQLGLEILEVHDTWSWGFRTKTGGYANLAQRRSAVFDDDDLILSELVNEEQLAFVLELGLFGSYQLRPNLAVRAGYDFLYITQIALAAENIGLRGTFPTLNTTGDTLYHGFSAGFEALW